MRASVLIAGLEIQQELTPVPSAMHLSQEAVVVMMRATQRVSLFQPAALEDIARTVATRIQMGLDSVVDAVRKSD